MSSEEHQAGRELLARLRLAGAHAYLFRGPDGVGKKLAATEFATALGSEITLVDRLEAKKGISIAQVQEIIRKLSLTSSERRAVIFNDAHLMSEEAMNVDGGHTIRKGPDLVPVFREFLPEE